VGPLAGITVVEIAGIGPGPFAGMLLADMGAKVIRVERPGGGLFVNKPELDYLNRGKRCIALNLKTADGVATLLRLIEKADAMFEGFRPGVVERLGVGPQQCMQRNPKLVYGRMTGWGQDGPWAHTAGHDINYIALSGALHAIGLQGQRPTVPLNLIGDFGGGGLLLGFGIVCALLEARTSGKGQVVDTAMLDGSALLMASLYAAQRIGFWSEQRGTNLLDSGAPFYDTYETLDGKYIAVGAIEAPFYAQLLAGLELNVSALPPQMEQARWPELRQLFVERFKTKTRLQWCEIFDGKDACVAPVLAMSEATGHVHNQGRGLFVDVNGHPNPAPAPRFSRTVPTITRGAAQIGEHTVEILRDAGLGSAEIAALIASGVAHDATANHSAVTVSNATTK
jgi:alpha-methylacyl-CoA racemase